MIQSGDRDMKRTPPPDPARVAIVQEITECTPQEAAQAINSLDEYDASTITTTNATARKSKGGDYASFDDLLTLGRAALVKAGYGGQEAAYILLELFTGLADTHGVKRLYLPKADKLQVKIQALID